jgi:hypothetical protein
MRVRLTDRFVKSAVPKGRKSPIFMDDEVIGFECSSFAALHESGSGHISDLSLFRPDFRNRANSGHWLLRGMVRFT